MTEKYIFTQDKNGNDCIAIEGIPTIHSLDEAAEELNTLQNEIMEDKIVILCDLYPVPLEKGGDKWYDTGCNRDKIEAGEWLVKNKGWIKSPAGVGRRQFYRDPNHDIK